jgi:hypothetical protein
VSKHNRLIRLVDDLPAPYACKIDPVKNILRINRALFEKLNPQQQQKVWRSDHDIAFATK